MRKFKILFLMLLGIFGLNSCVALGVAAGVGYAVPWVVAISCSEFGVCSEPKSRTPKQIERDEKLKLKKEIEEKNYIQNTILSKRKNKKIFENISILMPEKLEFRKVKEPREYEYSNVISELYDKEKKNLFLQRLFIVEKDKTVILPLIEYNAGFTLCVGNPDDIYIKVEGYDTAVHPEAEIIYLKEYFQ